MKYFTIIGKGENMRVYEFAKELGKDAGDFLEELNGNFGFEIKSHLSGISKEQIEQVRATYGKKLLSSLVDLKDELEKQVDDSHKQDLKETFNDTIDLSDLDMEQKQNTPVDKKEEVTVDNEWTLGSGDTIPPEKTLDEKEIEKLKKENEKAVKISMESAENAREEYAKTVKNIVKNPDDWANPSTKNQQEIIIEKPSWFSRIFSWWSSS